MSANLTHDVKASLDEIKQLAKKQREFNDAQTQARRKAWDNHITKVSSPEDLTRLMRELAANPNAW